MMAFLLAALALSAAFLFFLCLGDPKRRRSIRLPGEAQGQGMRRLLAGASLLPGIACAWDGGAAAFLIWLGGYAVLGWFITLFFSGLQDKPAARSSNPEW